MSALEIIQYMLMGLCPSIGTLALFLKLLDPQFYSNEYYTIALFMYALGAIEWYFFIRQKKEEKDDRCHSLMRFCEDKNIASYPTDKILQQKLAIRAKQLKIACNSEEEFNRFYITQTKKIRQRILRKRNLQFRKKKDVTAKKSMHV